MKRKPWAIITLAILHILAPFGNLVLNAHRADHSITEHWAYWWHFMPTVLFLSYVVLPVLAGIMIYICKRWSYWVYLLCIALIFASNAYSIYTAPNKLNFLLLGLVIIADILAVAYFVVPAVRQVYFDPRLRWWEAAPRYVFSNGVDVNESDSGSIRNISEGGLFVLTSANMQEEENVRLVWKFEETAYDVSGKVVYKSQRINSEGYGVQFNHTSETAKLLKNLCAKLRERGQIVPDRLPGPEDTFAHWLKNLISKREGLFPKR